jgi:hypothetical protein
VRGNINSWFKSYLTDRKQTVEINQSDHINSRQYKYFSSNKVLKHRVPQFSVIGSLPFAIYKNGLPLNVEAGLVLFVDDTNLSITARDENVLQHKGKEVIKKFQY